MKLFSIISVSMLLLVSCEQNLNLDKYKNKDIEEMLVVNSILNPDSIIAVSVTHPYFLTDSHVDFKPVESLEVWMEEENGKRRRLSFDDSSGLYLSERKPEAGEFIKLEINDVLNSANASDTVPQKVEIEEIEVKGEGPIHIYWDKDYRFTYKITFTDTPDKENFYFLLIEDGSLPYEFSQMGQVDYTIDYVFQVLASTVNQDVSGWKPDGVFGYPFSDYGIDGKRYTISVCEVLQSPLVSMIKSLPRRVKLYSISRSYFRYMVSVLSMDYEKASLKGNLLTLGLVEPTKIYTNIEGGAGVLGSYNLSEQQVDLLKLTGGWPR